MLLPVQLTDEHELDQTGKPKYIQPLPKQGDDESDNDYIQRQLPDSCIAYISGSNAAPEMPHLVVKGFPGIKLKWRLEVDYQRLNGWRADYTTQCLHIPEDLVRIPITPQGQSPCFTDGDEGDWRIFEQPDWITEISQKGFFGGTAKLYVWPPGQENASN